MVLTILEARVSPNQAAKLEAIYKQATEHLDAGILQTFLLRNSRTPETWQIATLWHNREALEAMRQTSQTPRGVLMLREVGAEPTLSVFEVVAHARAEQLESKELGSL